MCSVTPSPDEGSLSYFLEGIISKKVENSQNLNFFERVVDYIWTKFSPLYTVRYDQLKERVIPPFQVNNDNQINKVTKVILERTVGGSEITQPPISLLTPDKQEGDKGWDEATEGDVFSEEEEPDLGSESEAEEFLEGIESKGEYAALESLDFDSLTNRDDIVLNLRSGFLINLTHHKVELEKVAGTQEGEFDRFVTLDGEQIKLEGQVHGALSGTEEKIIIDYNRHPEFLFAITAYSHQDWHHTTWLVGVLRSHTSHHYYTKIAYNLVLPKDYARIKSLGEQHTPLLDLTEDASLASHSSSAELSIHHKPVIFVNAGLAFNKKRGRIKVIVENGSHANDFVITEYYSSTESQPHGQCVKWLARMQPDEKSYQAIRMPSI